MRESQGNVVLGGGEPLQKPLAGTAYATRSSYNTTQGATPAQMVFGRDMVLPVDFSIDWDGVTRRKQKRVNGSCGRENRGGLATHTSQVVKCCWGGLKRYQGDLGV